MLIARSALCTGGLIIIAAMLRGQRSEPMPLKEPAPE